ncbi:hypothetical protein FZZ93_01180 [Halomonas eurihalina]|uniref:MarR family transcriptional regulator n=1 Tax=Halomonas eurihalina TaxID=42566 RepID=A0A5D9DBX6_HALER|nr:hypothetical protein [Halomonas eurihalina]MDR5858194.1 hypothetical protein [Halomonas eurihalina]TZG41306.1 hypothetical protein FZZ93_01180 [Halomonas eurihalina]
MKPIDIEHEVLLALRSTPGQAIHAIRRRITTAHGEGPGWRQVANTVNRLERRGWVRIVAEQEINEVWHPAYGLTDAGREQADRVHAQRINARGAEVSV